MICISYTQSTNGHQSQHALLNAIWIGTCGNLSIKKQTVEAAMVKVFDAKAETWQLKFEQKADYVKTMTRRLANILRAVSVGMKKHGGCTWVKRLPWNPSAPSATDAEWITGWDEERRWIPSPNLNPEFHFVVRPRH